MDVRRIRLFADQQILINMLERVDFLLLTDMDCRGFLTHVRMQLPACGIQSKKFLTKTWKTWIPTRSRGVLRTDEVNPWAGRFILLLEGVRAE